MNSPFQTKLYHGFTDSYRNIGAAIYGAGALHEIQCIVGYIVDTYPKYASSAVAAVMFIRSLLSFALPLAAPRL